MYFRSKFSPRQTIRSFRPKIQIGVHGVRIGVRRSPNRTPKSLNELRVDSETKLRLRKIVSNSEKSDSESVGVRRSPSESVGVRRSPSESENSEDSENARTPKSPKSPIRSPSESESESESESTESESESAGVRIGLRKVGMNSGSTPEKN